MLDNHVFNKVYQYVFSAATLKLGAVQTGDVVGKNASSFGYLGIYLFRKFAEELRTKTKPDVLEIVAIFLHNQ